MRIWLPAACALTGELASLSIRMILIVYEIGISRPVTGGLELSLLSAYGIFQQIRLSLAVTTWFSTPGQVGCNSNRTPKSARQVRVYDITTT